MRLKDDPAEARGAPRPGFWRRAADRVFPRPALSNGSPGARVLAETLAASREARPPLRLPREARA